MQLYLAWQERLLKFSWAIKHHPTVEYGVCESMEQSNEWNNWRVYPRPLIEYTPRRAAVQNSVYFISFSDK